MLKQRIPPSTRHQARRFQQRHSLAQAAYTSSASPSSSSSSASKPRIILGIESSCDDSCASVVTSDKRILSSIVTRQDHSHTHGIHPLVAALNHHSNIPTTIASALAHANLTHTDIDAVAVTQGPGMNSSLGVGLTAAKTLAALLDKPIIYVHHMQAHALTPLLTEQIPPRFPFLTLLVSGGHTLLVLARGVSEFQILATTTDDSIGDAFDKVARDLAIPWAHAPGAALESFCAQSSDAAQPDALSFPVPQKGKTSFSYSGLKSAVTRHVQHQGGPSAMTDEQRRQVAQAFQAAACAQLEDKLAMALRPTTATTGAASRRVPPRIDMGVDPLSIKSVVCSGGVAANAFLRTRLRTALDGIDRRDVQLSFPPLALCTDNAAMIAFAGHLLWHQRTNDYTRNSRAKWSVEDI
ncbi:uncharacterized protein PFL1_00046 [Pseudozyma flocculosa PF-1]|nr:uncharacterized protein PFL1_00046 [Pseudozyma flocculosa PF-1]EPQ31847.1 hypothetical protein PFL1_00046 [Pseudozyma flocculosa PF-1]